MKLRFSVIGGDGRQEKLARMLAEDGHSVTVFGIDAGRLPKAPSLGEAVRDAQCIVLPIPVTREGGLLNAPRLQEVYTMEEVLGFATPRQVFVGGKVPQDVALLADKNDITLVDYVEREDFSVRNAVPSAEGALQLAMENTDRTVFGSRALVIGYGRIGRVLARLLAALGARVSVSARKQEDFAWIEAEGYRQLDTRKLEGKLPEFDMVFNTAPAMVLNEKLLEELPPACLVIDLASAPGGVDRDAAQTLGLKFLWALGLPGKMAPHSASAILRDTVYHIIREKGVFL